MQLQAFLFKLVKVRGPMGVYEEERAFPTGSGWFEKPDHEAVELKQMRFRHPHGGVIRYCSPDEVDESLRLGLMEQGSVRAPEPPRRGPGRPPRARDDDPVDEG